MARKNRGLSTIAFVLVAAIVIGTAVGWYFWYSSNRKPEQLGLTQEARQ